MKLIIGGRGSGQLTYAKKHYPQMEIIEDVHLIIRQELIDGRKPDEILAGLMLHSDAVMISDEIGCGIVPIDPFESSWRETSGRILTELAKASDEVVRTICGVGQKIK